MCYKGKVIIFSAPSGSGKSTIINQVLKSGLNLQFAISATNRPPRGIEQNGVEYYFINTAEFKEKIENTDFLEYEEVYPGLFYGTLRSEVDRITGEGGNVIVDVDVVGGCTIKKQFGERALSIFVQAPSIEVLRERLENRQTDSPEVIEGRLTKASYELGFASQFDEIIVNENLEVAINKTVYAITKFLNQI